MATAIEAMAMIDSWSSAILSMLPDARLMATSHLMLVSAICIQRYRQTVIGTYTYCIQQGAEEEEEDISISIMVSLTVFRYCFLRIQYL